MIAQLTSTEHNQILHWYHSAPVENSKLILKIVKHMNITQFAMVCSVLDSTPFARTTSDNWTLIREHDTNILRCEPYAFHLNHDSSNLSLHIDGRLSNIGKYGNVIQHYFKDSWAIPVFFDKGNENNRKTLFELGVAVPDMSHIMEALNILYSKDNDQIVDWLFDKQLHKVDLTNIDIYEQELTKINNAIANKR